jgi:hypothetical protein
MSHVLAFTSTLSAAVPVAISVGFDVLWLKLVVHAGKPSLGVVGRGQSAHCLAQPPFQEL